MNWTDYPCDPSPTHAGGLFAAQCRRSRWARVGVSRLFYCSSFLVWRRTHWARACWPTGPWPHRTCRIPPPPPPPPPQSPSRRYTANSSNRSEVPDEELAQFGTCFETTIILSKRKAPESALVIAAPPRALFPSALARQRGAAAAPLPAPPAGLRRWVRRSACLLGPWLERQRVRLAASPR